MRHAANIEVDRIILERRQQHLEDERLVDRDRAAEQVAAARRMIIGIYLPQDFIPVGQVIEHRIVGVGRRGGAEDRLEQRCQFAVRGGFVGIAGGVVRDPLGKPAQPALQRQSHRKPARGDDVLLHHRLEQLDHRRDARHILGGIAGEVGAARPPVRSRPDRICNMPGRLVEQRRKHLRLEIDPAQRGGEVELRRGKHLDAIGRIVGRVDLVEMRKVDRVIAQRELAAVAGLPFELDRPIEIARPDIERAVAIGDLNGVIDHPPIGKPHPDPVDRQVGVRIEPQLLAAPFGARSMRQRADIGDRRVSHRGIRRELPRPISLVHAIIDDHRPPRDDPRQIRRGLAAGERRTARRRRPSLLKRPALAQRPAVPFRPLEQLRAVCRQTHRIQLARLLKRLAPRAEQIANLSNQRAQIRRGHRCGGRRHPRAQRRVVGRGDRKVGDRPEALGVERRSLPARSAGLTGKAGIDVARRERGVEHAAHSAAGEGYIPVPGKSRTLRRGDVERARRSVEAGDTQLVECEQLARIGHRIAVDVPPNPQAGPDQVGTGDLAVAVRIDRRKLPEARLADPAKHLRNVVDAAVAVGVEHEKAVVALEPAGALGEPIAIDIEVNIRIANPDCLDPIAIKIDDQRIGADRPQQRLCAE